MVFSTFNVMNQAIVICKGVIKFLANETLGKARSFVGLHSDGSRSRNVFADRRFSDFLGY